MIPAKNLKFEAVASDMIEVNIREALRWRRKKITASYAWLIRSAAGKWRPRDAEERIDNLSASETRAFLAEIEPLVQTWERQHGAELEAAGKQYWVNAIKYLPRDLSRNLDVESIPDTLDDIARMPQGRHLAPYAAEIRQMLARSEEIAAVIAKEPLAL